MKSFENRSRQAVVSAVILVMLHLSISYGVTQDLSKSGPITVFSKSIQYFSKDNKTTFKGDVVIFNDNFTVTADSVDVLFLNKNEIEKIVCRDRVNFKSDDIITISDMAEIYEQKKLLVLTGNAKVWNQNNYLEGEIIQLQYETKETYISKGSSDKVTVIVNAGNK